MSNQDLKHFSKSALLEFAGVVFHGFLPPEGDLTKELTNKITLLTQQMIFSKKFTLMTFGLNVTFSSQNQPFLDLTNSKVRASPSGVGSDPPSV